MIGPADFSAAVLAAKAGDTLQLAPGSYGDQSISKKAQLTLVGNPDAKFNTLQVSNSQDISMQALAVDMAFKDGTTTSSSSAVRLYKSQNVEFVGGSIMGPIATTGIDPSATAFDPTENVVGFPTGCGLLSSFCDHVRIAGTLFSRLDDGITLSRGSWITVEDCDLHDLRQCPVHGQVFHDLTIQRNHSWKSTPWNYGGKGDHGDAIHIWTVGSPLQSAHTTGVVIEDNLHETRDGVSMMGIYLDTNTNPWFFDSPQLNRNIIVASNGQGMRLENCFGAGVAGNQLFAADPIPDDVRKHPYIITVGREDGQQISGNRCSTMHSEATDGAAEAAWLAGLAKTNQLGPTLPGEATAAVAAWIAKFRPPPAPPAPAARPPLVIAADMQKLLAELTASLGG